MFCKKHAVKWTIRNFLSCLDNWRLGCPNVAFSAQTQQLWRTIKLFQCYKAGISVLMSRLPWEIRQCAVLLVVQFPSIFFFSPPPFPIWLLFHILFQQKQDLHFIPSPSPLFAAVLVLQLQLRAPRQNRQPKLTESTASQMSLGYAPSSSKGIPQLVHMGSKPWLPHLWQDYAPIIRRYFAACRNITFGHILWMPTFRKHFFQVKVKRTWYFVDFQVELSTVVYSFDSLSKNSTVHTYALISPSVTTTALKISLGESLASGQYHSEGVVVLCFFSK